MDNHLIKDTHLRKKGACGDNDATTSLRVIHRRLKVDVVLVDQRIILEVDLHVIGHQFHYLVGVVAREGTWRSVARCDGQDRATSVRLTDDACQEG